MLQPAKIADNVQRYEWCVYAKFSAINTPNFIKFALKMKKLFKNEDRPTPSVVEGDCLWNMNVSQKNWATFIFTVTMANVGRFFKFFYCWNQKEITDNKNEKLSTTP